MSIPYHILPGNLAVGRDPLNGRLPDPDQAHTQALSRWQRHGLGIFVHWGVNCQTGYELSYSRGREQSVAAYDQMARTFQPRQYNVEQWADLFAEVGAGYVIPTGRHADGFCYWPTETDDHHIGNTPHAADHIGALATACRERGLEFGCYLSIADWRHPLYGTGSDPQGRQKLQADPDAWLEHVWRQAAELLERYGPLLCLWFDAEWDWCWRREDGVELYRRCRQLQPDLLINDRVDRSRQGLRGPALGSVPSSIPIEWLDPLLYTYFRTPRPVADYFGDFRTVENEAGAADYATPWEVCVMLGHQWSWDRRGPRLSSAQLIDLYRQTRAGGGNLLVNVSPDPDGLIPDYQAKMLRELGAYIRRNPEESET